MRSPSHPGLVAGLLCLGAILPSVALADRASEVLLPPGEKPVALFDGRDLAGWEGLVGRRWMVEDGTIRGVDAGHMPASTYLFTKGKHRDARRRPEAKQTRGDTFSTMHSAVAVLGEVLEDKGGPYGFKGPLVMFCNDWGVWDANRRNRVFPPRYPTNWRHPAEIVGDWNQIEGLVRGGHPLLPVKELSVPPMRGSGCDGSRHPVDAFIREPRAGEAAAVDRCHPRDPHATLLVFMGSHHQRLTSFYGGRENKLPGVVKTGVTRVPIA